VYDPLHDRQAQPCTVTSRPSAPIEGFENAIKVRRLDSRTTVVDPQDRLIALAKDRDIDPFALWGIAKGVVNKVPNQGGQTRRLDPYGRFLDPFES
jgi:hypothetical protein